MQRTRRTSCWTRGEGDGATGARVSQQEVGAGAASKMNERARSECWWLVGCWRWCRLLDGKTNAAFKRARVELLVACERGAHKKLRCCCCCCVSLTPSRHRGSRPTYRSLSLHLLHLLPVLARVDDIDRAPGHRVMMSPTRNRKIPQRGGYGPREN